MLGRGQALDAAGALVKLLSLIPQDTLAEKTEPIEAAYGMVLSRDVVSPEDLPGFDRSTVDGYAVRSSDTFGATEVSPAYINVTRDIPMGLEPGFSISPGEAARIATGGMLPVEADSVLMLEHAQSAPDGMLEVQRPVAPGENVIRKDEDAKTGEVVLKAGQRLRPEDVSALAGLGITRVDVRERPGVSIISTGDEVVPPGEAARPGIVRDMNSYLLEGLVIDAGGMPLRRGILKDDYDLIMKELERSAGESSLVLISGGSSVGTRDMTEKVVASMGEVIFHSIAMKPGKPLLAGMVGNVPVFGLPGHPRAVKVCFEAFVRPVIDRLSGCVSENPCPTVTATLSKSVHSAPGRRDVISVSLYESDGVLMAEPLLGKSGLISTLVKAQGSFTVLPDTIGIQKGEKVNVRLG